MKGSMRPALDTTSVPAWTIHAVRPDADLSGRYWTVVAMGQGAEPIAADWTAQIAARHPGADVRVHAVADDVAAADAVATDLVDAVVGWRLMIAGPADACLRLRAAALQCGVADDEITIASTTVDIRAVHCVHCGALIRAKVDLEDVVACVGCDRELVVHYHVSRRLGAHLGFAADVGPAAELSTP
jgi:dimethylamine monooxygenase subunit C